MDLGKKATVRISRRLFGCNTLMPLNIFLGIVFFFSGAASLLYQVVWQRLLTLYYGVGSLSVTLIVSVYMLGLGFGAFAGGALAERVRNRMALYMSLELALGFFGLVSLPALDFLGRHTAGSSYPVSFACMFLFLCFPTLLMGMTLPLMVKEFNQRGGNFDDSVSFLYFINTAGAALGALAASYGIISFSGLDTAVYAAASINLALAACVYGVRRPSACLSQIQPRPSSSKALNREKGKAVYFWIAAAGFLGIGYEIIWCRVVEVLVKASPYAFSSVLFVYLAGISAGSLAMKGFLKKKDPGDMQSLFFFLQALCGICVLGSILVYYQLTSHTPFKVFSQTSFGQSIHPPLHFPNSGSLRADLFLLFDIFLWPFFFFFVPALCLGAGFPVIAELALLRPDQDGQAVGHAAFFLSVGNVLGGLITGLWLLPVLGTERVLFAFGATGILMGLAVRRLSAKEIPLFVRLALGFAVMVAAFLFFPRSGELYQAMHFASAGGYRVYFEEGREGVVMTYEKGDEVRNYINGLAHGARPGYEFYREAVEAARYAGKVDRVLIIGFGTGSILEAMTKLDEVKSITLVELNATLMKNLRKMELFRKILSDPRIHLVMDDGRRFLARTQERFDLVLIDPLRTTTAYSNNLYSLEFFKQVRRSLTDQGVFMVWMDEYSIMPKTVAFAFRHMRLYSYFALASQAPFSEKKDRAERLLESFPESVRTKILKRGRYLGDEIVVLERERAAPINQDLRPVCEYYLGLKFRGKPAQIMQ